MRRSDARPGERNAAGALKGAVLHPSRLFGALLVALNSVGTVWVFVLMLVIIADVLGRTVLSAPLPGVPELVSLSIVGIVFLQLAHTVRAGRVTRVSTLSDWLARRRPRAAAALAALYSGAAAALFAVLFLACRPLFVRAWTSGEYAGVEGYVAYPVWPIYLIILVGCACSAAQFALLACSQLAAAMRRGAP